MLECHSSTIDVGGEKKIIYKKKIRTYTFSNREKNRDREREKIFNKNRYFLCFEAVSGSQVDTKVKADLSITNMKSSFHELYLFTEITKNNVDDCCRFVVIFFFFFDSNILQNTLYNDYRIVFTSL